MPSPNPAFWRGRRVFLTGHTGFKGSWAALWLTKLGASVTGFALAPETNDSLFTLARVADGLKNCISDIGNQAALDHVIRGSAPDIVLHMAAQAQVRRSYSDPVTTWETNVLGTLNLLKALRGLDIAPVVLVVTSDKIYRNDESGRAFREEDPLGGHDPYSASKAATEILISSWGASFAEIDGLRLATARSGNVIGGGDFSEDRIIPDIWRAIRNDHAPVIRNPDMTRPWQHVLDCLNGYLLYTEALATGRQVPTALNFGPTETASKTVREIADDMLLMLAPGTGWTHDVTHGPHEMAKLTIDSSRAREVLAWRTYLTNDALSRWTADWYTAYAAQKDMRAFSLKQIDRFTNLVEADQ